MRFRIHFEHKDGTEDSFDLSGETLDEIRKEANLQLFKRTGSIETDAWSEVLPEQPPAGASL